MRRELLIFLLLIAMITADCGCGTKCFAYSDPSRCTRCCTATVKRSLRTGPDGEPLTNSFLHHPALISSYAYPKWNTDDRFLRKLSDILGLITVL